MMGKSYILKAMKCFGLASHVRHHFCGTRDKEKSEIQIQIQEKLLHCNSCIYHNQVYQIITFQQLYIQ